MKHFLRLAGLWLLLSGPALAVDVSVGLGDANYTAKPNDVTVITDIPITAARTVTLPSAGATCVGTPQCGITFQVIDAGGTVTGTNTLSVAPASGDRINGSTSPITLSAAYGRVILYPVTGSSWSAQVSGASAGITALTGDVTATGPGSVAATLATAQPAVHTWALAQTFTVAPVFTNQSASRTALGITSLATTVNGQTCTLGAACTVTAAASSIVVGTTTISGGTTTRVLYDNAGVLGEMTTTGTGTTLALSASPTFTGTVVIPTPFTLGAVSVTSTGTQLNYLASAAGTTGTASTNVVFSASPTFTGIPVLAAPTATTVAIGGCTISTNAFCVTGASRLGANVSAGGVAIDTNIIFNINTNAQDPSAEALGLSSVRTLVLSSANSNNVVGGDFNVATGANAFNATGTLRGIRTSFSNQNTATVTTGYGIEAFVYNVGVGTITTAAAMNVYFQNLNAAGVITNMYGLRVADIPFNSGTMTNTFGVWVGDMTTGTQTNTPYSFYASDTNAKNYFAGQTAFGTSVMIGSITALTLTSGALGMQKITASASAPGAAGGKLELVCGTNAGSAKLVAYAGTSGTAVTIIDNIGAGVTAC